MEPQNDKAELQKRCLDLKTIEDSRSERIRTVLVCLLENSCTINEAIRQINAVWIDCELQRLDVDPSSYPPLFGE